MFKENKFALENRGGFYGLNSERDDPGNSLVQTQLCCRIILVKP